MAHKYQVYLCNAISGNTAETQRRTYTSTSAMEALFVTLGYVGNGANCVPLTDKPAKGMAQCR